MYADRKAFEARHLAVLSAPRRWLFKQGVRRVCGSTSSAETVVHFVTDSDNSVSAVESVMYHLLHASACSRSLAGACIPVCGGEVASKAVTEESSRLASSRAPARSLKLKMRRVAFLLDR